MPWQETLVIVLASFVWQGAMIAGLLILLTALFRIQRPVHRYTASLFAFVLMAACPIVTWSVVQGSSDTRDSTSDPVRAEDRTKQSGHELIGSIPRPSPPLSNRITDLPKVSDPVETDQPNVDFTGNTPLQTGQFPVASIATGSIQVESTNSTRSRSRLPELYAPKRLANWIVAVWIVGVGILSLRLALGVAGTRTWRLNLEVVTGDLTDQVRRLCQAMSMSMPRVQLSQRVTEALVVGLWRPMILIPVAWVTELPPDMVEAVLAHELAHIRRFDLWVNLGQRIFETLLFYHPAVWWLSCRLRVERELCCDAAAVQSTRNAVRYAETLEHIALRVRASGVPCLAIGMRASNGVLLRRIRQLLGSTQSPPTQDGWFAGGLTFTVALAVAFGAFGKFSIEDSFVDANAEKQAIPTSHDSDEATKPVENETNVERAAVESATVEKSKSDATTAAQSVVEISANNEQADKEPAAKPADQFRELLDQAIEVTGKRLLTANAHSPWQIFQSILAMGRNCQLRLGNEKVNAIEWISTTEPRFDGEPWMLLTPDGAKFHPYTKKYYFEGHPGQFLALLSESDLPQDHEFHVEGKVVTLRDVIHNTMNEVDKTQELSWVLWGLQHYLDSDATWKNLKGEEWSIERLVEREARCPIVGAPCGGTIRLFALTRARDTYLQKGGQLQGVWSQADQRIKQFVENARSFQNPDGSFSADYYKGRLSTVDVNRFFATTGYTMEFLSIAVPDEDLNEPWIRNAVEKLARELNIHQKTQVDCDPLFHSLHALILYRERLQARVAAENKRAAELLVTLTRRPSVAILRQLLASSGQEQPDPVQLLDNPRSGKVDEGDFIIPIDTPHGRIMVVGCKVVPLDQQRARETKPDELPDAAFLFDAQGRLIARLGGECGETGSKARDSIDLINLGPEEDWFVRVKRFEADNALKHRTDFYRIDNPVVPSLRYVHNLNSSVSTNGSRTKPRFGRLYFDSGTRVHATGDQTPSIDVSQAIEQSEAPQGPTQFDPGQPLAKVVIEGNKNFPEAEIMKHITIRAGQSVTRKQMKDDVDALVRLRWFAHVEPRLKHTEEGLVLGFVVLERPLVQRVEYKGLKHVKQKAFDALIPLKPGSAFDIGSNREYARCIEEYYRAKGFAFASVELEKGNNRDDREVVFAINEGPKVRVDKVELDDNNRILRVRSIANNEGVEIDRESARIVENYYRENGFPFATVELEKDSGPNDRGNMFVIKEGPRIHVSGTRGKRGNQFSDPRTGITKDEVKVLRELTWDGDRNRFLGVPNQSADGQPLYQVDAAWSREFEGLTPARDQLVISGGDLDYDQWSSWDFVVPENCEGILRQSIIQQNGDTSKMEKNLDPGVHSILVQVKPSLRSAGTALSLKCDGGKPEELILANRFDHPTPNKVPIVQVVNAGSPAKIVELSDTARKVVFKVEVEIRR